MDLIPGGGGHLGEKGGPYGAFGPSGVSSDPPHGYGPG